MGNSLEYAINLRDGFSGVASKVKGSVDDIGKGIQNLSKTASSGMSALSGDFSKLGDVIGGIGGPAAAMGAAVVGALGGILTKTMEASEGFRKLSEKTGASVEFLSGFTQAADDVFVSSEAVNASLTIFAKKLGGAEDAMDGSGTTAGAFAKKLAELGIVSGDMEDALGQVADRFAGMKDGSEKTALAVQLFGKQGVELIPILNKGRDAINEMTAAAKEMGLVMTTETTQAVTRLKQVLDNLSDRAEGAALNMGSGLVKAAADAGEAFLKFDDKQRVMWQRADADNWLGMTLRVYKTYTEVNDKLVKTLSVSSQALRERGEWAMRDAGSIHDATRATVDMGQALENVDGPTRTAGQLAGEMAEAFHIATMKEYYAKEAAEQLAAKQQALADATNNVNSAFGGTPKAMDNAEKAMQIFRLNTGGTTKAQFEQQQAMEAIRSALDNGALTYEAAAKALIGLRDGTLTTAAAFDIAGAAGAGYRKETELVIATADRLKPKEVTLTVHNKWDDGEGVWDRYIAAQDKTVTVRFNMVQGTNVEEDQGGNHRAKGGPVKKGQPYTVGEQGPEMFVPYASGYIVPNSQTPYTDPGTKVNQSFNVNNPSIIINSANGAAIAQQIARQNLNVARRARARASLTG